MYGKQQVTITFILVNNMFNTISWFLGFHLLEKHNPSTAQTISRECGKYHYISQLCFHYFEVVCNKIELPELKCKYGDKKEEFMRLFAVA